jgi:hypothetical protein
VRRAHHLREVLTAHHHEEFIRRAILHEIERVLTAKLKRTKLLARSLSAANDVCALLLEAQAIFFRRRHHPRRPPLAKIRPGSPAPATGAGTGAIG